MKLNQARSEEIIGAHTVYAVAASPLGDSSLVLIKLDMEKKLDLHVFWYMIYLVLLNQTAQEWLETQSHVNTS